MRLNLILEVLSAGVACHGVSNVVGPLEEASLRHGGEVSGGRQQFEIRVGKFQSWERRVCHVCATELRPLSDLSQSLTLEFEI